ncbi:hypothetical protein DAPPUDRAFT_246378 [Daphnia pulex]|uniref:Uncharacterized protein n=1 Tax=Daphnia pulex TaxID=6669 RepID=E9GQC1_DAPPU|nr:hypothetical protein DAPPUDRAFT_246378 [Daphnia pulex]|eukprot:EFX78370.1 hypothetical protein DAPPUDRAFT_246378 [Daphnia pulex]
MYAAMHRAITALGKREETNQSDQQMSGIDGVSNSSTVLNNSRHRLLRLNGHHLAFKIPDKKESRIDPAARMWNY